MRHHVQEKRKQRKMSHGSAEKASDGITWPVKADAGLIADTESDASSTVAQESSDSQFSVWELLSSSRSKSRFWQSSCEVVYTGDVYGC
jgi:hypothetical protein